MITDAEIEAKAAELRSFPSDVEKDYVHGWFLKGIAARPGLAPQLVLKGGNALRKGYLTDARFSKDLDFSAVASMDRAALERELRDVCAFVEQQTGVHFVDKTVIKDKDLPIPDVQALEARIYFKGFYNEEKITLKTQLDIAEFDRIHLPIQNRALRACNATHYPESLFCLRFLPGQIV